MNLKQLLKKLVVVLFFFFVFNLKTSSAPGVPQWLLVYSNTTRNLKSISLKY